MPIDLRAPASAPGCGSFRSFHAPVPLGCAAPSSGVSAHGGLLGGGRPLYAQASGPVPPTAEGTPILALHALPGFETEMLAFFQGRCRTRPAPAIKSWPAFAEAIKAASPIVRLLVYSHGAPGQLRFGTLEYGLEQDNIRPLFLGRCQTKTHGSCNQETVPGSAFCKTHRPAVAERWVGPNAKIIDFEGCTVGQRPASMAKFAKLLGASSISGFTWFHVGGTSPGIPIPKGATVEMIAALMLPIQKYLFVGQPSAAEYAIKAKSAGFTATPWIEYFIEGTADLSKGVPHGAIARSQVKVRSVTLAQASALEDEYDASLKLPCEQVVVTL